MEHISIPFYCRKIALTFARFSWNEMKESIFMEIWYKFNKKKFEKKNEENCFLDLIAAHLK